MLTLRGVYRNGIRELERNVNSSEPLKVLVTFLDDETETDISFVPASLRVEHFLFQKTRTLFKDKIINLSDEVIKERRQELD